MSYVLNLITDRTPVDSQRVVELRNKGYDNMTQAERNEWNGEMKGRYDNTDFNRVEAAVAYLAEMLQQLPAELMNYAAQRGVAWDVFFEYPYNPTDYANIETKTTWTREEWLDAENRTRYLDNVHLLRESMEYATNELPETMENFTVSDANAIERALVGLDEALRVFDSEKRVFIDNALAAWFYSADVYAGEVTG